MELAIIRHALPVRVDEGTVEGPADPPLAPLGRAQAEALATWLATERIHAVWSSPMRRARETAAPMAERLGLEVQVDERLAEYDRHATSYIPLEELKAAGAPRWNQVPERPEEFQAHVVAAMEDIAAAHPGQRVAVVCHGGAVNAYVAHVLGLADPIFFLPGYTSISRVLAASSGQRSVSTLNDTAHLRGVGWAGARRGAGPPEPAPRELPPNSSSCL